MRTNRASILLVLLGVLTAGCGGDDNASEAATTTTATTTPEQGATAFCAARDEWKQKVMALGPQPEAADREAYAAYNADLKKLSVELRATAPEEIRDVVDAIDPSDDSPDASQQEAIRVYGDYVARECQDG